MSTFGCGLALPIAVLAEVRVGMSGARNGSGLIRLTMW